MLRLLSILMSYLFLAGGGNGNSPTSQQFFDRLLTPPTGARETLYSTMIDSLVSGGVWAKLDTLCLFAASDVGTALTNLVQNSFRPILVLNNDLPSFTVDRGLTGEGFNGRIESAFIPSSASGKYTLNDAMIYVGNRTATQFNNLLVQTNSSTVALWPKNNSGNIVYNVNSSSQATVANAGSSDGLWLLQRTASNAVEVFKDNVSLGTSSIASTSLPSEVILHGNPYQTDVVAIGSSLTSGERITFDSAVRAYLTGVGAI